MSPLDDIITVTEAAKRVKIRRGRLITICRAHGALLDWTTTGSKHRDLRVRMTELEKLLLSLRSDPAQTQATKAPALRPRPRPADLHPDVRC